MKGLTTKQTLQLLRIAQNVQRGTGLDEVAFVTLMRICRDYVTPGLYPAIPDDERDNGLWIASTNSVSGSLRKYRPLWSRQR